MEMDGENFNRSFSCSLAQTLEGKFLLANRVWVGDNATIKPSFADRLSRVYAADVAALPAENAADVVNEWISAATKGKISKLFGESTSSLAKVHKQVFLSSSKVVSFNGSDFSSSSERAFPPKLTRRAADKLSRRKLAPSSSSLLFSQRLETNEKFFFPHSFRAIRGELIEFRLIARAPSLLAAPTPSRLGANKGFSTRGNFCETISRRVRQKLGPLREEEGGKKWQLFSIWRFSSATTGSGNGKRRRRKKRPRKGPFFEESMKKWHLFSPSSFKWRVIIAGRTFYGAEWTQWAFFLMGLFQK